MKRKSCWARGNSPKIYHRPGHRNGAQNRDIDFNRLCYTPALSEHDSLPCICLPHENDEGKLETENHISNYHSDTESRDNVDDDDAV